ILLRARSEDGRIPLRNSLREANVGQGLDTSGRPVVIPNMEPSEKGTLVYPSLQGSTNWASPAYSPATGLFYVPVREMGSYYYKSDVEYRPGTYYTGGSERVLGEEAWG